MKIKRILPVFFLLFFLSAYAPLCLSAPQGLLSSDKKAAVTLVVRDSDSREVMRASGVVVDKKGVVATTPSLIARWLEDVGYSLSVETAAGEPLSVENVLSVNNRLGLAVIAVQGNCLYEGSITGAYRMEYIRNQIARYERIKDRSPEKERKPLSPSVKSTTAGKADEESRKESGKEGNVPLKADDVELHLLLAMELHKARGYEDALDEYLAFLKARPGHVEALTSLGILYTEMGKYAQAIETYNNVIALRPELVEIYNKLATVHMIREDYAEAITVFSKALEIDTVNINALYGRGMAYFMTGDKNAALDQYIILNRLDKKRADELFNLVFQ